MVTNVSNIIILILFGITLNYQSKRKLDDADIIDITITNIQLSFSGSSNNGKPIFTVTIAFPSLDAYETFQDSPSLYVNGTEDNIEFGYTFSCSSFDSENSINYVTCKSEEYIYGSFSEYQVTSDNALYNYIIPDSLTLKDTKSQTTTYIFYGLYNLDNSSQTATQELDKDTPNIIIQLTESYEGEVFIFDSNTDSKQRLECKANGTDYVVCSGGVVDFNVDSELYYLTGTEHNLQSVGITVNNKYSIAVKSVTLPFDAETSCSSIELGYTFSITIENTGLSFTAGYIELELENDSDGYLTQVPANCTIPSGKTTTISCTTLKTGKGGKQYYLKDKSGSDCVVFNNGKNCIYIYNMQKYLTTIQTGYAGLAPSKNSDLSYNKDQLTDDDYPRTISVHFRDAITLPTSIKAGDFEFPSDQCELYNDDSDHYFTCKIYKDDLSGVDGSSTTYKTYEITFYDICLNYRRGPSIKVAGDGTTDDDNEEETEHDFTNTSKKSNYLKINQRLLFSIVILFFINM